MKLFIILSAALLQAGCASTEGFSKKFETNAYCKVGEAKAASVSSWWLFGISTELANGAAICVAPGAATGAATATSK